MSYFETKNRKDCSGCTACVNICPKNCIDLVADSEGFLYPHKNVDDCINCNLCDSVCPFRDSFNFTQDSSPKVLAAYDRNNRVGSSSGGIFYTIAKYVIEEKHGWVFGAAFDSKLKLVHVGVNDLSSLQKLRGSKYIQSNLEGIFLQIKNILQKDYVCFVGTPCQVAGLKSFLKKDYDNLLLIDLVCHGVPSQLLFDKHIEYLENKYKSKVVSYKFRNEDAWGVCEIVDFANHKKIKNPSYELSPFLYSFMYAYTYRESCYNCKFAKVPRIGDITLADFWGVSNYFPDLNVSKGCSLILINKVRGELIWNSISKYCETRTSTIEDAAKYNGNLISKSIRPIIREDIYKKITEIGYAEVVKRYFRPKHYCFAKIKNRLLANSKFMSIWKRIKNII